MMLDQITVETVNEPLWVQPPEGGNEDIALVVFDGATVYPATTARKRMHTWLAADGTCRCPEGPFPRGVYAEIPPLFPDDANRLISEFAPILVEAFEHGWSEDGLRARAEQIIGGYRRYGDKAVMCSVHDDDLMETIDITAETTDAELDEIIGALANELYESEGYVRYDLKKAVYAERDTRRAESV